MDVTGAHEPVTGLAEVDRGDVARLLDLCNRHEGLDLPIAVDPGESPAEASTWFGIRDGGHLIGVAWVPPDPEPEVCLMVHPAYRRRGLGRALLAAARSECRRRGLVGCLLVCDEAAGTGKAFAATVGARYRSSEYRLELDPTAIDRSRPRQAALLLRPVGVEAAATLTRLLAAAFGDSEDEAREGVERRLSEPNRRHYLAMLDGEPIGTLRLGTYGDFADVTGFGVLPEFQGRGYGRQMLLDAVETLLAEGWKRVLIEVATDNERALGLYRSCGFEVASAYGFYDLAV
jgi:ribosomal protein S18 acetylase RimI-like enzyme